MPDVNDNPAIPEAPDETPPPKPPKIDFWPSDDPAAKELPEEVHDGEVKD